MNDDLKTWLLMYRDHVRYIDILIERASILEMQISSPQSPQLDGIPHGSGRQSDPIGNAVARLEDLRSKIAAAEDTEKQLYRERDAAIDYITGKRWAEWREVLKMRYLDGMAWEDICFSLFGGKDDFGNKAESYQRRTFGLHKEALRELNKIYPPQAGEMRKNNECI